MGLIPTMLRRQPNSVRTAENPITRTVRRIAIFIGLYMGAAVVIAHTGVIFGDTIARQTNAQIAIMSRDPHIAALGFVFNPLPSLMVMPLLFLRSFWLNWTALGYASDLTSAICMALAARQIYQFALSRNQNKVFARIVTAGFALHPFIIIYGANGMSEAAFVLSLTAATRHLLRWQITDDVHDLASAGLWLAFGYGARYEAIVSVVGGAIIIFIHTWHRTRTKTGHHYLRRYLDVLIFVVPTFFTMALLIIASWVTTGIWIAQFQSVYGNTAQIRRSGGTIGQIGLFSQQVIGLETFWPFLLAICLGTAFVRRDTSITIPIAIFGPVLAFETFGEFTGGTRQWLRFFIVIIPFTCYLAILLRRTTHMPSTRRIGALASKRPETPKLGHVERKLVTLIVVVTLFGGAALSMTVITNEPMAGEESTIIAQLRHKPLTQTQVVISTKFLGATQLAAWLDRQNLPEGSVIVDAAYGFGVIAASRNPKQFVTTPDQDFQIMLVGLGGRDIQYAITVPTFGLAHDALAVRYPGIFEGCLPNAQLVFEVGGPSGLGDNVHTDVFRVYDVSHAYAPNFVLPNCFKSPPKALPSFTP